MRIEPHLSLDTLAGWCAGSLTDATREAAEAHLADCGVCRRSTGGSEDAAVEIPAALLSRARDLVRGTPARRTGPGFRSVAAALIASLCVAIGVAVSRPARQMRVMHGILGGEGGTRSIGIGDPLRFPGAGTLTFPDGTVAAIEPGGAAGLLLPKDGERLRLRLDGGCVSMHVQPGAAAVVVETPCGEVRVLGTEFSVRLWRDPLGRHVTPGMMEVGVRSGKVAVGMGGSGALVRSGGRAYARAGAMPRVMDPVPQSPRWAGRIMRTLDALVLQDPPAVADLLIPLAELRHQGNEGLAAAAGCVLDRARPPRERVLWARLFSGAFPGDAARAGLLEALAREADEGGAGDARDVVSSILDALGVASR